MKSTLRSEWEWDNITGNIDFNDTGVLSCKIVLPLNKMCKTLDSSVNHLPSIWKNPQTHTHTPPHTKT